MNPGDLFLGDRTVQLFTEKRLENDVNAHFCRQSLGIQPQFVKDKKRQIRLMFQQRGIPIHKDTYLFFQRGFLIVKDLLDPAEKILQDFRHHQLE